jgi:hypothetical protein
MRFRFVSFSIAINLHLLPLLNEYGWGHNADAELVDVLLNCMRTSCFSTFFSSSLNLVRNDVINSRSNIADDDDADAADNAADAAADAAWATCVDDNDGVEADNGIMA